MIIKVLTKNVYGQRLIYPLNFIKELTVLTNSKTLSYGKIEALKKLGFTFEVIPDKL